MRAPDGWPCQCIAPGMQLDGTFDAESLDLSDITWHQLGCHVRLNAAAMAVMKTLFDVESMGPEPHWIDNGLSERNVDDLYRFARWQMELLEQYRRKEAHYGRSWAEMGWLAQVVQLYRRARRLMVMGWWKYDETTFDRDSADQNAGDLATHAYFFHRLLEDNNRKGHLQ